ncbi:DUF1858 domain-containing protein [Candidatus Peregrinibacteria bacterium]|nr:DUF1858 domain-containing protein [Candidatus Peregrinibacteria bacterium]
MTIRDVVAIFPEAADIMMEYGLHCFSCAVGGVETLMEGCRIHGFDDDTAAALIADINEARGKAPRRPLTITITEPAARGILEIMQREKKEHHILLVTLDETGGFCMEFRETAGDGDGTFGHTAVPDVRVCASAMTLSRIGGATIDFRDGRFKLDLKEECCKGSGGCACH